MSYVTGFLTFMSIGGFPSFVEDMKVNNCHITHRIPGLATICGTRRRSPS